MMISLWYFETPCCWYFRRWRGTKMRWFEGLQMIEIGSSQYEVRTKTPRKEALIATGAASKGAQIICAGPASDKIVALLARSFFCITPTLLTHLKSSRETHSTCLLCLTQWNNHGINTTMSYLSVLSFSWGKLIPYYCAVFQMTTAWSDPQMTPQGFA